METNILPNDSPSIESIIAQRQQEAKVVLASEYQKARYDIEINQRKDDGQDKYNETKKHLEWGIQPFKNLLSEVATQIGTGSIARPGPYDKETLIPGSWVSDIKSGYWSWSTALDTTKKSWVKLALNGRVLNYLKFQPQSKSARYQLSRYMVLLAKGCALDENGSETFALFGEVPAIELNWLDARGTNTAKKLRKEVMKQDAEFAHLQDSNKSYHQNIPSQLLSLCVNNQPLTSSEYPKIKLDLLNQLNEELASFVDKNYVPLELQRKLPKLPKGAVLS